MIHVDLFLGYQATGEQGELSIKYPNPLSFLLSHSAAIWGHGVL